MSQSDTKREHGQWIKQNPMVDTEECSVCGYNIISEEMETPFCPWCGADMRDAPDGEREDIRGNSMTRKHNIDDYKVKVDDVLIHDNCIVIQWSGNIGFGEYTIWKDASNGKLQADSERMDNGEDKAFLELLLKDIASKIDVT